MCIFDFVGGMTDLFALKLYRNLRGIEIPMI
jgi:dGTPase